MRESRKLTRDFYARPVLLVARECIGKVLVHRTADGAPHAVLIREFEPLRGIDLMAHRRRKPARSRELTNGPGKLTNALAITGADYGRDLCGGQLYLERSDVPAGRIGRSTRINVDYAGVWASKRWRFYERGNRYVSVAPRD